MNFKNTKLEEFNEFLENRKVAVIGLGVSNMPLLEYLYEKKAKVTIFDQRSINELPKEALDIITKYSFEFSLGQFYLEKLKGFELIFRSPSCLPTIPELVQEEQNGAIITTEIELVLKMTPSKVIGVTGSDGKTTTTTLIYEILKHAGYKCFLGGNIGTPLFTRIKDMKPEDIVILELSSFQLMGMEVSPNISVITNISPNHLNIHKDYQEYIDAKKNIFKYQDSQGILIINFENDITKTFSDEAQGKVIYFSSKTKLENGFIVDNNIIKESEAGIRKHILSVKDIKLRGIHNFENICAALAATKELVDIEEACEAIKSFQGVEHRLELVKEIEKVKWYNDSVSSSPTRTIAGLNSYDEEIVLIAGGYDKNLDYTPIAKPIVEKVKTLILLGQTSSKIYEAVKKELEKEKKNLNIYMCDSLEEAVNKAKKYAKPGQIVLFSPASASFDMFKNFADRGEKFKNLVNKI